MTVEKLISGDESKNAQNGPKVVVEQFSIEEARGDELEIDTDKYKVYTRRWFMLLIPLGSDVLLAFRTWRFPIVNIICPFYDTSVTQVVNWSTLPLLILGLLLLPCGRALNRWGTKNMIYVTIPILLTSNVVQSITLMDESNSYIWIPKQYRFGTFVFCNILAMISLANFMGLTAKIANDWFAAKETTLVLVLPYMFSRTFESAVALLTPIIVKTQDDLRYIGYINLTLISLYTLITLACVNKSQPRIAPSKNAQLAREQAEPPISAFIEILKIPAFPLAMFSYGFNLMAQIIMKAVLAEALSLHGYTNQFSGVLIAVASIVTCFGGLFGAWLDKTYDYVLASKIVSILMATTFCVHYMSHLVENISYIILVTGTLLSFFHSTLMPLQLQAMLRPSKGILPDASVACLNALISSICNGFLTYVLTLTKEYSPANDNYFRPYVAFCVIIATSNMAYAIGYNFQNSNDKASTVEPISKVTDTPQVVPRSCVMKE